ncbi:MAG TPA: S8 family serine peptidase [Kineosporiaceae bacterium]
MLPVPRGPSTTAAPAALAAGVAPGETVRIAAVRVVSSGARVDVVRSTGPQDARAAIAAAQADPAVVAVEVDHRVRVADASGRVPATPDPDRSRQWALDALRAEQLWPAADGAGQVVAVVDTGVEGSHPDLDGRVLVGYDVLSGGGTGNTDPYGHGTHVAGIVAASAGNGIGVEGLAPQALILPVRALDAGGGGWDSDIATAIIWATDHGATVINLSLGGPDASDAMRGAIVYAINHGVVVVAAVGNERADGNPVEYPAAFGLPGLIAVAATTSERVSAAYSNTGSQVMIAAPGSSILSTYLNGTYALMSGTSMAAPYVSAAVAAVRSAEPGLAPAQVAQVLIGTADDLETPGRDDDTGTGLVDPLAAVCSLGHCPTGVSPTPSGSPSPSPSPSPTPAPLALGVRVQAPAAPIVSGALAVLTVTVSDVKGPVSGAGVTAVAAGRTLHAVTNRFGAARLAAVPARTGTWIVTVSAAGHRDARATVVLPVAPKVVVRWRGSKVTVSVTPVLGQLVTVWTRGRRGWVRHAHHAAAGGGVTLPVPAAPAARVTVSGVPGLAGVTSARP